MHAPNENSLSVDLICVQVPASLFKKLDAASQRHFILQAEEGWLEKAGTTYLCFSVARAKDAAAFVTAIFAKNPAAILAARRDAAAEAHPRIDTEGGEQ